MNQMGFGEVIKGENELIILIKDYLANNCKSTMFIQKE